MDNRSYQIQTGKARKLCHKCCNCRLYSIRTIAKLHGMLMIIICMVVSLLITSGCSTQKTFRQWKTTPDPSGKIVSIPHAQLFYKLKGSGDKLVIIETGFGTLHSKWIPIQDSLSQYARVLIYDRGDYGYSSTENYPRSSEQLSMELAELLKKEHLDTSEIYLLGHSFGANQVIHHALHLPNVKGMLLLDPGSYEVSQFVKELQANPALQPKTKKFALGTLSGTGGGYMKFAGRSGLIFWLYKLQGGNVNDANYASIINTASQSYYRAMDSESAYEINAYTPEQRAKLATIHMQLITANWQAISRVIAKAGKLDPDNAHLLMRLYNEQQKQYLSLSDQSSFKPATTSEHDIYLFEPQIVIDAMRELLR